MIDLVPLKPGKASMKITNHRVSDVLCAWSPLALVARKPPMGLRERLRTAGGRSPHSFPGGKS